MIIYFIYVLYVYSNIFAYTCTKVVSMKIHNFDVLHNKVRDNIVLCIQCVMVVFSSNNHTYNIHITAKSATK
mgnify:CR=1 FL=1